MKSKSILDLHQELRIAGPDRLWYIADAFRYGFSLEQIHSLTLN